MNNGNNSKNNGEFGGFGFADSNDASGFGGYAPDNDTSGFGSGFVTNDNPPGFDGSDQGYDYNGGYQSQDNNYNNGYASQGTNSGFAGSDYGTQNNSYGPQNNNFGGQGAGNYNYESSQNNNNNYNSYGSNNSFDGNTGINNDMNYDPNAPLYNPQNDFDPNMSLYNPDGNGGFSSSAPVGNSMSSASRASATVTQTKGKYTWILIIALVLVFMSIGGFILYKALFEKKTIKEYWDSSTGQAERETLKKEFLAQNADATDFDIITEGDDVLVYEVTYNKYGFTSNEKASADAYFEMIKPTMKNEIQKIMSKSNIREFKIIFRFKGRSGNVIAEYTYTL